MDAPTSVTASVAEVLRPYRGRIKACYERELKSLPDLAGKITLSWGIGDAGTVTDLATEVNSTGSAELETCVRRWIGRAQFPPGAAGTWVDGYPLIFTPE